MKLKKHEDRKCDWVMESVDMYVNAVENDVMLYSQQDSCNITFKIET
jgi:hypothetical protein